MYGIEINKIPLKIIFNSKRKSILIFYSVFEGVFTEHPLLFTMVAVAQLVRAPDCGSGGRGFETHQPPIWLGEINGHCLLPNFAS